MQPEHPATKPLGSTATHELLHSAPGLLVASRSHTDKRSVAMASIDSSVTPAAKLAAGYLLTDTEVAELCGCAVATLRNMRWRGEGPAVTRLGKRMVRYTPEAVRAFIEGQGQAA